MSTPEDALIWAQSTRDTHHGYNRTMERAEAYRAGHSAAAARIAELRHVAGDLLQHLDWLTSGLPDMLERASLTDEEGLIGAAVDAANSARAALESK